jgi:acetamidase/formamidase
VEIPTHTVIVVDVIKQVPTPGPRLESDTHVMSIGTARPLEDAYRISQHDLVAWTSQLAGLDMLDAYQFVSQAGAAPVGNVVDPNYTMLAALPKRYLPAGVSAYGGVHQRLADLAAHH